MTWEQVGAVHGRIRRSVEGLVKLLKLSFMDFAPAILTAGFALGVAIHRQPVLGLVMTGVIPIATLIVVKQIQSQKGIRLELLRSKESVDGPVVEQLGGIEYVRAADTHEDEVKRVEVVGEAVRRREIRHHVAMSLFDAAKALNEGLFFILVVGLSISLPRAGLASATSSPSPCSSATCSRPCATSTASSTRPTKARSRSATRCR